MQIYVEFILKGDSSCYIFSRNYEKIKQPNGSIFSPYTSVIKIQKDDKCQKTYISLGTFTETNGILCYKTFSKIQLLNISSKNK